MGYELYGAECPVCTKPMLGKLEPLCLGAFQFDACPHCGFIEFETSKKRDHKDISRNDRANIWAQIVKYRGYESFEQQKAEVEKWNREPDAVRVFNYTDKIFTPEHLANCQITPEEINRAIQFPDETIEF